MVESALINKDIHEIYTEFYEKTYFHYDEIVLRLQI